MSDHTFTRDRFVWLNQVLADRTLPANAFRLAYAIGTFVNRRTRVAFPSIETLAERIGVSVRKTRVLRTRLIGSGHVAVKDGTGTNRGNASVYSFVLKEDPRVPLSDEKEDPTVQKGGPCGAPNSWSNSKREGCAPDGASPPTLAPDGASESSDGEITSSEWEAFEELWRSWIRKKVDSQDQAWLAYQRARSRADHQDIATGAKGWLAAIESRYRQPLHEWLDNGGWQQQPPVRETRGVKPRHDRRTHIEKTMERMRVTAGVAEPDVGLEELRRQAFRGRPQ